MAGPGILRDYNSIMAEFSMCTKSLVDIVWAASELLTSMPEGELDKELGIQEKKEQFKLVIQMADKSLVSATISSVRRHIFTLVNT